MSESTSRFRAFAWLGLVWASSAFAGSVPSGSLEKTDVRMRELCLGSYATSRQVEKLATDDVFRSQAWATMQRIGISKLYLEVYRGGHTVAPEQLVLVRDWFAQKGVRIVGGIATVPGGTKGIRQEGPLGWFNWQNPKTQRDLKKIVRSIAPIFETFIVDDFLCTGDVSAESRVAKGDRSWGVYRRALLTELAQSIFVDPARQVNPDITMIVKYPQWYDRFHLFGYDTETLPHIFDQVWVGTETRGRHTQRFGFVQPYEGFVNYRWLAGIAGRKIGGAWFDHGDCAEYDILDQAYTSVLAGAPELVFFNLGNVMEGHPDHEKIVAERDRLADLANFVSAHPVAGVPAYKPPNSDPGGDMYLMDFLGMLGIPLAPVHRFPENAPIIFIPAQAAADSALPAKIGDAIARGAHVIITTSLLIALPDSGALTRRIGITLDESVGPIRAALQIAVATGMGGRQEAMVDLERAIEAEPRPGDLFCTMEGRRLLFLRSVDTQPGRISLLNTHTFDQSDFDAVGEVLLCPRELGLLDLDGPPLSALRDVFGSNATDAHHTWRFNGPPSVTYHPFSDSDGLGFVVQNFNDQDVRVTFARPTSGAGDTDFVERFSGTSVPAQVAESGETMTLRLTLPARGRAWIQPAAH